MSPDAPFHDDLHLSQGIGPQLLQFALGLILLGVAALAVGDLLGAWLVRVLDLRAALKERRRARREIDEQRPQR